MSVLKNPIGAHVSGGNDLSVGLEQAKALGCEAMQVFLSSPQSFKVGDGDADLDAAFSESAKAANIRVFVHGPYIMNFGSPKATSRWSSQQMLTKTLARAKRVGAEAVVLHSGSSSGDPLDQGYARLTESLLPVLEGLDEDSPMVLLEPMAGGGTQLAHSVATLAPYFEAVAHHEKLGLCLDTAHLLAAGERLDEPGGTTAMLAAIDATVGLDRVKLVHANDSKVERGSKRDRHESLGLGHLQLHCWSEFFAHPDLAVPLVLETPSSGFINDLQVLRAARA